MCRGRAVCTGQDAPVQVEADDLGEDPTVGDPDGDVVRHEPEDRGERRNLRAQQQDRPEAQPGPDDDAERDSSLDDEGGGVGAHVGRVVPEVPELGHPRVVGIVDAFHRWRV